MSSRTASGPLVLVLVLPDYFFKFLFFFSSMCAYFILSLTYNVFCPFPKVSGFVLWKPIDKRLTTPLCCLQSLSNH